MSAIDDLNNPNLFDENQPGDYSYSDTGNGKVASGQLSLTDSPVRDAQAQRTAGGEARRTTGNEYGVDDGGHLIGARFGGSAGEENLTPQDRNLNRAAYKQAENDWAKHLEQGDKVYVHMESYEYDGAERPTNYMGYAIIEHTDENGNKTRDVEYYSFNNESRAEQENWEAEEEAFYQENPEAVQEQAKANTTMPYIWDEEKGDVVENPNYIAEEKSETSVNPYMETNENEAEVTQDNPYAPAAETEETVTDNSYSPAASSENEASQTDAENAATTDYSSDGPDSGSGQDMD